MSTPVPLWMVFAAMALMFAFGYFTSWYNHGWKNNITPEQLRDFLERKVHYEEMEVIKRNHEARMARRKYSPRPDGGEGIRIRKMSVRGSTRQNKED